jgi:prepilin peptidase CpaA
MPQNAEVARWLLGALLLVILAAASISDIRDRTIPNWAILAIALLFVPWAIVAPDHTVLPALAAALAAFLISCSLYLFRVVGAGDSKLLTAVALFVGLNELPRFLIFVVLAGGVMAAASLLSRPVRALVMFQMRGKGNYGRGIPYGIAISAAAAYVITWPLAYRALVG